MGIDVLLGHLLVKRIPVISEYSFKGIQGRQKLGMHKLIPNWPWTLNDDKYSAGTKDFSLRLKFWSILLYNHWLSTWAKVRNVPNDPKLNLNT